MKNYAQKVGIKAWAEADRPREKLGLRGRRFLTDAELVSILISSGNKEETAVELSKRILQSYKNDLNKLGKASINELSKFKGIGAAKAISLVAAFELGRRRETTGNSELKKITNSNDAHKHMVPHLSDLNHEEFWIILLNRANIISSTHQISVGGQAGTIADPKIIFKIALENNAAYIILAHNHPSGQLKPSDDDIKLTDKLVNAGKLMDILIYDHLIITNHGFYSFADNGGITR